MNAYCPRGQRKNRKTRECEPYIETPPKYSRCLKVKEKINLVNANNLQENQNVLKDHLKRSKKKIEKLENANHTQNQQIEQDVLMEQGKIR